MIQNNSSESIKAKLTVAVLFRSSCPVALASFFLAGVVKTRISEASKVAMTGLQESVLLEFGVFVECIVLDGRLFFLFLKRNIKFLGAM